MEERLQWIRQQPKAWASWQPLRGGLQAHVLVAKRYSSAECFVVEPNAATIAAAQAQLTRPWWQRLGGAAQARFAPPPEGSVNMVWANMALHMASDPQGLIADWHSALKSDGFLMFSCLGPDTLGELRAVYRELGLGPAHHDFTDMHDWGDMLVAAGFAEPVMDMERIRLSYDSASRLLQDLRALGRNLHPARFAAARSRKWHQQLEQAISQQLADAQEGGRLALTFEVIYGHAHKPLPRVGLSQESAVSLRDMREMLARRPSQR